MEHKLDYKSVDYKIEDLSQKNSKEGTVRFVASVAGNVDSGSDLISSGKAFNKTVKSREMKERVKHFREHDTTKLVGFPTLSIDGDKLWANSELMLNRDIGRDTYEIYKAAASAGRTVEHSIGYLATDYKFETMKEQEVRIIDEMMIWEVSTLSAWGMNKLANEFDFKSMDIQKLILEEKFFSELLNAKFGDVKLDYLEKMKNILTKEIESRNAEPQTWLDHININI